MFALKVALSHNETVAFLVCRTTLAAKAWCKFCQGAITTHLFSVIGLSPESYVVKGGEGAPKSGVLKGCAVVLQITIVHLYRATSFWLAKQTSLKTSSK